MTKRMRTGGFGEFFLGVCNRLSLLSFLKRLHSRFKLPLSGDISWADCFFEETWPQGFYSQSWKGSHSNSCSLFQKLE